MNADPVARFVANLDCEGQWAGRPALPARLLARVSALGTLVRALAREGDTLWTPTPVDPARVPPVAHTSRPRLETGDLARLARTPLVVAWGATEAVASARGKPARGEAARAPGTGSHWRDRVRHGPACPASSARRVNHRAFCLAEQERLGVSLRGTKLVHSVAELDDHLRAGGAAASPTGRWVLKAPLAAAGRDRLRGGPADVVGPDATRLRRLLVRHGELLFEPWMERVADHGSLGFTGPDGVSIVGRHVLDMSGGGSLRAVRPLADSDPELDVAERASLDEATRSVGRSLAAAGYAGPFGLDAYRYRDADGITRYQPLCEINARLTFGFVARALAENAGWTADAADPAPALHLGARAGLTRAGAAAVPLLLPSADDEAAAWLS